MQKNAHYKKVLVSRPGDRGHGGRDCVSVRLVPLIRGRTPQKWQIG